MQTRRLKFDPWVGKIPWRREWQPTPLFLPRKSQGQRGLAGDSPWGRKQLDRTERLTLSHFNGFLAVPVQSCFRLDSSLLLGDSSSSIMFGAGGEYCRCHRPPRKSGKQNLSLSALEYSRRGV